MSSEDNSDLKELSGSDSKALSKDEEINVGDLSMQILQDIIKSMAHEVTAKAIQMERRIRFQYGNEFVAKPYNTALPPGARAKSAQKTEVIGRVAYLSSPWSTNALTTRNVSSNGSSSNLKEANTTNNNTSSSNSNSNNNHTNTNSISIASLTSSNNTNIKPNSSTTTTTRSTGSRKGTPTPASASLSSSALEDMYGVEKSTEPRYFECTNCGRKIAGSRFAAHLERCLGGRNSRHKDRKTALSSYSLSVDSSPSSFAGDSSSAPSPAKSNSLNDACITNNTNNNTNYTSLTSSNISLSAPPASTSRKRRKLAGSGSVSRQSSQSAQNTQASSSFSSATTQSLEPSSNSHEGLGNGPVKTAVSKFLNRTDPETGGFATGGSGTNGGSSGSRGNGNSGSRKGRHAIESIGGVDGPHSAPSSPRSQASAARVRAMSEEPFNLPKQN